MTTSVALCTYNGEAFIKEQLVSILTQTHSVDEIIICDDGSTDSTLDIIASIGAPNITVHTAEDHRGVSANFQSAVNLCHGEIIFLCDQDDVWHPNKVEHTIAFFLDHPEYQVIFSNGHLIDRINNPVGGKTLFDCVGMSKKACKMLNTGLGLELFMAGNRATGATMAMRNTFPYLHSFSKYCHEYIIHDYAIVLLALSESTLGYIKEPLLDYRIHPSQQIGMGKYLDTPLGIRTSNIAPTAELIRCHSYPKKLVQRAQMIAWRESNTHRWFAPFSIMFNTLEYFKFYHGHLINIVLGDLWHWFTLRYRGYHT